MKKTVQQVEDFLLALIYQPINKQQKKMKKVLEKLWKQIGEEKFIEELSEWLAIKQKDQAVVWTVLRVPSLSVKYPDALIRKAFSNNKGSYKRKHKDKRQVRKRQHMSKIIRTRNN
ncbi:MAG: hypothetical protein WBB28_05145 [Crinalium sp.]